MRTGARDPAARGAVGAHPTCPKRNRYARGGSDPRTAAAAVARSVLPPHRGVEPWTRGGPVELAGGAYRGFGTLGDGHAMRGAVAGRSPPARPAVASVHTLSSGCAPSQTFNQNMLEQHKGSQTFNDFRHTEQAAKSSPNRQSMR